MEVAGPERKKESKAPHGKPDEPHRAAHSPAREEGTPAGLPAFLERSTGAGPQVGTSRIAAKLTAAPAGDPLEEEAERAAEQVAQPAAEPTAPLQEEEEEMPAAPDGGTVRLSRSPGASGPGLDAPGLNALPTDPGRPLPERTRRGIERQLGADFRDVRVHHGEGSARANRELGAEAFTYGRDIFFGEGRYSPESLAGRRLLGHELAHVVQQGPPAPRGEVRGRSAGRVQRLLFDPFGIGNALDPLAPAFNMAVTSNQLVASAISIPSRYVEKLIEYARHAPADGIWLLGGLLRRPTYYSGGWILDVQQGAKAMTLDRSVFVDGDLDIDTYVHEMVHVRQYGFLGITGFLTSYFGASAATIAIRFLRRQPLNVMQSSPHENQAYNIEARFHAWHQSHP